MPTIHKLPPDLISKIAAGEVIERPAYVVKELLDNSLDAGAGSVYINIVNSGLKKIEVRDDGRGMDAEDLLLSFQPHTSSKISNQEDLNHIKTLGFRGEALASIAAVANLTIQSRHIKHLEGKKIVIRNNKLQNTSSVGMPVGTIVTVENLFAKIPARKKFLHSQLSEWRLILEIVSKISIANPNVEFKLIHNNKTIFHFTHNMTLNARAKEVFGEAISNQLYEVKSEMGIINLNGFLTRPQSVNKSASKLWLFVNGRSISNQLIINSIKEAYANLLEPKSFPIGSLFIKIPPEHFDVNIHPRKEAVSFVDQKFIYDSVYKSVSEALKNNNLTFYDLSWKDNATSSQAAKILREEVLKNIGKIDKKSPVIQLHNLYLITETKKGIMLIDQHAADEAILFRKFKDKFSQLRDSAKSYQLKPAVLITLPQVDRILLKQYSSTFSKLGFEIEEFGPDLKVNKMPMFLKDREPRELIAEILADLEQGITPKIIDDKSQRMLSYLACKSAIKAGTKLSKSEIRELIDNLKASDMTYTCPHGRPVMIEMSLGHLNHLFRRR